MTLYKNKKIKIVCLSLFGALVCLFAVGKVYQYANMQAKYVIAESGEITGFTYRGEQYVELLDFEQHLDVAYGIYGNETSHMDRSKKIFLYQAEEKIKDIFTYIPLYGYQNDPNDFFWVHPGPGRDVVYIKQPQTLPSISDHPVFKIELRGERWCSIEDAAQISELLQSLRTRGDIPAEVIGDDLSGGNYTLIAYYSDYPIWEKIGTWDGERFHFA